MSLLGSDTLKHISNIICGDIEDLYPRKSGPQLVSFFNEYFGFSEVYGQGFPSRWTYVYNHLVDFIERGVFDEFLTVIFDRNYIIRDQEVTEVIAAERSEKALHRINEIVRKDGCTITKKNGKYHLTRIDEDMVFVGNGGFANVFYQKSTGLIVKKLKEDFLTDKGIRSRFKREFNITQSLQDIPGVIKVFSYDDGACTYTMEKAEKTLYDFISQNDLPLASKVNCIRQMLYVMSEVHKRDIIHRDLSPTNIFIINGRLKIADFGLGKDLNVFASHQTMHTNEVGQYWFCAPEQFMMLKDGDKRSDVYSLGRIINFIMNGNPISDNHVFRSVCTKATNDNAAYRYADAAQLSTFFEKAVAYNEKAENKEAVLKKISNHQFDDDVENYIYSLNDTEVSKLLLTSKSDVEFTYIKFMQIDDSHAEHLIQAIDSTFRDVCKTFESNDAFASLAKKIIQNRFDFAVKETAANILRYIAFDVNRFSAQHMIEDLIDQGIEPMLEDLLRS